MTSVAGKEDPDESIRIRSDEERPRQEPLLNQGDDLRTILVEFLELGVAVELPKTWLQRGHGRDGFLSGFEELIIQVDLANVGEPGGSQESDMRA